MSWVLGVAADPSWFYSSLAQATAALVGFAGGFWIMRLQHHISTWEDQANRLVLGQQRWASLDIELERQENEAVQRIYDEPTLNWSDSIDQSLDRERGKEWNDLRRLLDAQAIATFPRELTLVGGLLAVLYVVGCVVPLQLLGAPGNGQQAAVSALVGVVVLATGMVMHFRARGSLRAWRAVRPFRRVHAEYEEQLINEQEYERRRAEQEDSRRHAGPPHPDQPESGV